MKRYPFGPQYPTAVADKFLAECGPEIHPDDIARLVRRVRAADAKIARGFLYNEEVAQAILAQNRRSTKGAIQP